MIGKGDRTFQAAVSYAVGTGPAAIVTTDCDGDGKLDLVIADGAGNSLSILRGKGDGTFLAGTTVATGGAPGGVVSADLDGNGITDLAVTNSADDTVSVFLGATPKPAIGIKNNNFDGDLISGIGVWRPSSGTWFGIPSSTPGSYFGIPWDLSDDMPVPGDYDGDGRIDIAVWRPEPGTVVHNTEQRFQPLHEHTVGCCQ